LVFQTAAVNCWELPVLTLAGLGETETWICLGAGCCGVVPEPEPGTAAHPARSSASAGKSVRNRRFKEISSTRLAEMWSAFSRGQGIAVGTAGDGHESKSVSEQSSDREL
jgi:hypothetical protein